jgi:type I restriction enzyme S subunit
MADNEVPTWWEVAPLADVSSKLVDGSHNPPAKQSAGHPMLSAVNICDNKITFSDYRLIADDAFLLEDRRTRIAQGDVLLTIVGAIGRSALVSKATPRFTLQRSVAVITPLFLDSKFLMYQFEAPRIALHFKKSARGTAQKGVYLKTLGSTEIWIPPLAEQRRIVAKIEELFSELDKGIENLKTAQAQLKIYRQALLKHAFEGKLTVAWRAKNKDKLETAEVLLKRIQAERTERYRQEFADWEAGGKQKGKPNAPKLLPPLPAEELVGWPSLPEGWVWLTVKHVCDVVRGGSPRPAGDPRFYGGTIPFLKVADITHADTPYIRSFTFTIKEAGLNKTREIVPNTLLLSNSGATLGVPKICLISATMNDGVAAFLGLPSESLLYHYYFWQSKTAQLRNIDQGAAQPNLNTDLIKDTFIPLCSQPEQLAVTGELEAKLSEVDQLDQTISASLQQAEALRQSILKRAFSGQLVPQDPKDEPASVLLARIKAEKSAQPKGRKART